MAKTRVKRKAVMKKSRVKKSRVKKSKSRKRAISKPKSKPGSASDPLLAAVKGAERRNIGHVRLEVGRAGAARVKRMIYPPGFRWSKDMKPVVGTDLCMHAHVGFLAQRRNPHRIRRRLRRRAQGAADRRDRSGTRRVGRRQGAGGPDRIRLRGRHRPAPRDARRTPPLGVNRRATRSASRITGKLSGPWRSVRVPCPPC